MRALQTRVRLADTRASAAREKKAVADSACSTLACELEKLEESAALPEDIRALQRELEEQEAEEKKKAEIMSNFFLLYRAALGLCLEAQDGGVRAIFDIDGREATVELRIVDRQYVIGATRPQVDTQPLIARMNKDLDMAAFFCDLREMLRAELNKA